MDKLSEIKQSIVNISKSVRNANVFTAEVERIDGEKCSVSVDDLTLTDVRLRAVINGENSKLLITPKIKSSVLVIDLSGGQYNDLAVVNYSEIDKIEIDCDNKIVINGGNNDGIIKINELTQKLNDLVNAFNNHIHITTATVGAAPAAGEISAPTPQAQNFNKTYYENDKILH